MPFAIAGAAATAAVGIGGAMMQADATKSAASSARAAQEQALAQARADTEPWRTAGTNALGVTTDLAGANGPDAATAAMKDFYTSPGYQWRMGEGMRAVDAGAAASGMLRSGAALKAEQTFGQGLASGEFTNYYNRLYDLSKLGEAASVNAAEASQATGAGIARTDQLEGAQQANIIGGASKGIGEGINKLLENAKFQGLFSTGMTPQGVVNPTTGYTTAPGMANAGYQMAPGFGGF